MLSDVLRLMWELEILEILEFQRYIKLGLDHVAPLLYRRQCLSLLEVVLVCRYIVWSRHVCFSEDDLKISDLHDKMYMVLW